jgi:hypothetical protein
VVEWLTLLFPIREAPGSSLGSESGYPHGGFSWLSSVPPGEFKDSTLVLGHDRFFPNPFQFIIRLSLLHLTLYSISYRKYVVKSTTNKQTNVGRYM